MKKLHPESFVTDFENYFDNLILIADMTAEGKVIAIGKPFVSFAELIVHISSELANLVDFSQPLEIHIYKFGYNHCVQIKPNGAI